MAMDHIIVVKLSLVVYSLTYSWTPAFLGHVM